MNNTGERTSEYGTLAEAAVLIPAYEPDQHLPETIQELLSMHFGLIAVVDDGSSPSCMACFQALEALGVAVLHHDRNRGKGAAIKTGIRHISQCFSGCKAIVTADADGQHDPEDIRRVAECALGEGNALVLGVRDFSLRDIPGKSRLGNRITSLIFRTITHVRCPDTQTGLRGIPAKLFPLALVAEGERYEYEMNFLLDVAGEKVRFEQVPIRTIYIDQNRASHFRVIRDSYLIYRRPITFLFGSAASSLIDLTAFYLFLRLVFQNDRAYLFLSSVLARIISGCFNFFFNKRITFRQDGDTLRQSLRYLCLFLAVMFLSSEVLELLGWLPVPALLIKVVVDTLLFIANYVIERKWVFRKE